MKRQLNFSYDDDGDCYILTEEDRELFSINGGDLKFSSRDFYEGIYKNNDNCDIEVSCGIGDEDPHFGQGNYILSVIKDIISEIKNQLDELEVKDKS